MRATSHLILVLLTWMTVACARGGDMPADASNDALLEDALDFGDAPRSDAGACSASCSPDLHSVLDCNGNVMMTCPEDQGCGVGGMCVSACQAAADNKSSVGCDYYSVMVGQHDESTGSCFAAYVANTWSSDVGINVSYKGQSLNAADFARIPVGSGPALTYQSLPGGKLPPGKVAILFLYEFPTETFGWIGCPIKPAVTSTFVGSATTSVFDAFHVTMDRPVVVYDIWPYGGAKSFVASATLLLPTSVWDTNYVTVDGYPALGDYAPSFTQIVAMQDATSVTISPTSAIAAGFGVSATGKGQPHTYTLDAGQVLQIQQKDDLSGSAVQSDRPIGVWGGAACMNIPSKVAACDSVHQQLFPVKAMGNQYVAVKYRDRGAVQESPPWKVVGTVDGTTLSYAPNAPPGAPAKLMSGEVVEFAAAEPFVVASQDAAHPFHLVGHMTGGMNPGALGNGDPEMVNVIPPAQWLSRYTIMTDPTYAFTELVLTRGPDAKDVTLDCLGTVTGWTTIAGTPFQWARVDLVDKGAPVGKCDNGAHELRSSAPFGITVWGFDQYSSYGYPGGAGVRRINNVVVSPNPR